MLTPLIFRHYLWYIQLVFNLICNFCFFIIVFCSMAGATQQNGPSGARVGSAAMNDKAEDNDEDDEILYVPPRLKVLYLTVNWPLKCPVKYIIGNS